MKQEIDIEKLKKEIEALEIEEGEGTRAVVVINEETKLSILWAKVQPFVLLLSAMVRGKAKLYLNAFTAAINELVKKEEEEDDV